MARPDRLAVKVIARLNPPDTIGISMASVSKPSSGSWNAIDVKVLRDRKVSDAMPNSATMTARKPAGRGFRR